jgi:4-hydroxybenzoyl-CoA reductase beta subunit
MRLPKFDYLEPKTLKQATKNLFADVEGSVLLAGGTDLLVRMKQRLVEPRRVINLKAIPNLNRISEGRDGVRIGALTSLHDLASSPLLTEAYPAITRSSMEVGAYVHRTMGTLGGNLCQGNRCRFYNQSPFWRSVRPPCYKAGGKFCYVVPARPSGERGRVKCYSAYCGDMAPVFIAMDAQITVKGPGGERVFALKKLFTQNGKKPLSLKKGEILKEIHVPRPRGKTLYLKWRLRESIEFPIVSVAVNIDQDDEGKIKRAKIVLSGIGPGPFEASEAERLLAGRTLDDPLVKKASDLVSREISPVRTSIVSVAYRRKWAGVLVGRALEQLNSKPQIRN